MKLKMLLFVSIFCVSFAAQAEKKSPPSLSCNLEKGDLNIRAIILAKQIVAYTANIRFNSITLVTRLDRALSYPHLPFYNDRIKKRVTLSMIQGGINPDKINVEPLYVTYDGFDPEYRVSDLYHGIKLVLQAACK